MDRERPSTRCLIYVWARWAGCEAGETGEGEVNCTNVDVGRSVLA